MDTNTKKRQPVVAVVGHIDHGKSTLLDYIRKTNIVDAEVGGITQHLSAYEVTHKTADDVEKNITFLDTPGHAAFEKMRARGLEVADVAILVVSAEEGVKQQTIEAVKSIKAENVPYIVAINKIDKEGANPEKTKNSLVENEIYIEGMGGDVPYVLISAKRGDGINELLDLILLQAELKELKYDPSLPGTGTVIEASVDTRKGVSATLIIQDGTLESGMFVVAGDSFAPVRIMENFAGKQVKEAHAGNTVRIIGFSKLPAAGQTFTTVKSKKDAESMTDEVRRGALPKQGVGMRAPAAPSVEGEEVIVKEVLPVVIRADTVGTIDAIFHEIQNIKEERLEVLVVSQSVGAVSEADVKLVGGGKTPGIVLGFNTKIDNSAKELAERLGVTIEVFDIIYKLAEWLQIETRKRAPRMTAEEVTGAAKILKVFSSTKHTVVLGGKVEEGMLADGAQVRLLRRDMELARGTIKSLQSQKAQVKTVEAGIEFGAQIEIKAEPAPGDRLECFTLVEK